MKKYKWDFIVVFILIIIAFASWILLNNFTDKKQGNRVEVYVDNQLKHTYALETDGEYEIGDNSNKNIIVVKDKQVYMKEADCPDRICVRQGKISNNKETIICLPHKLVVKVVSDKKSKADAVAQ